MTTGEFVICILLIIGFIWMGNVIEKKAEISIHCVDGYKYCVYNQTPFKITDNSGNPVPCEGES